MDRTEKKDLSLINCIATSVLAYLLTVPVHEFFHLATFYLYGIKCEWFTAGSVQELGTVDYSVFSPFHRVMVAGGSASILNFFIGMALFFLLLNLEMGATARLLLTQVMGGQMAEGFGYFLFGGMIKIGDWGNVFAEFKDAPGFVMVFRIILIVLGSCGIVFTFFALNYMSYYFISDPSDRGERFYVAFRISLLTFLASILMSILAVLPSPMIASGDVSFVETLLWDMALIVFFWGFMFTWVMVKHPKESRGKYPLPKDPNYLLWILAIALALFDILVLGPGIKLN